MALLMLFVLVSCHAGGSFVDKLVGTNPNLVRNGGIGNDALVFSPNPLDFAGLLPVSSTEISTTHATHRWVAVAGVSYTKGLVGVLKTRLKVRAVPRPREDHASLRESVRKSPVTTPEREGRAVHESDNREMKKAHPIKSV